MSTTAAFVQLYRQILRYLEKIFHCNLIGSVIKGLAWKIVWFPGDQGEKRGTYHGKWLSSTHNGEHNSGLHHSLPQTFLVEQPKADLTMKRKGAKDVGTGRRDKGGRTQDLTCPPSALQKMIQAIYICGRK